MSKGFKKTILKRFHQNRFSRFTTDRCRKLYDVNDSPKRHLFNPHTKLQSSNFITRDCKDM